MQFTLGHKDREPRVNAKNVIGSTTGRETAVSDMLLKIVRIDVTVAVIGGVIGRMQAAEVEAHFFALNMSAVRHATPVSVIY